MSLRGARTLSGRIIELKTESNIGNKKGRQMHRVAGK